MNEKAIWITVEEPVDAEELEKVQRMIEDTRLTERYEIILTSENLSTIDMDELREFFDE